MDNHKANKIGRNLLPRIGIILIQEKQTPRVLNVQRNGESNHETKQWVKDNFQQLCIRTGKSKHHVMRTQFSREFEPIQQKGRRKNTSTRKGRSGIKQFEWLKKHHQTRQVFRQTIYQPNCYHSQKNQSVKLALDSKKINKYIHKNKYQMPNIDPLLGNIAQVVKSDKSNKTFFSNLDLRYAYSQIPLDEATRELCNFSLIGGNATGTYQFQTGFYGCTDMTTEFQKAADLTLFNCNNTYAYLDDILIVTKGTIETHR